MRHGTGRYLKTRSGATRFARARIRIEDTVAGRRILVDPELTKVYLAIGADWTEAAIRGVERALDLLQARPCEVNIATIEGTGVDTSPAAVEAAASLAVFDALGATPSKEHLDGLDALVFASLPADEPGSGRESPRVRRR